LKIKIFLLAGLEPGQDGYDRAESGDQLSDEDESDEAEITHAVPLKCIGAAHEKNYQQHLEQAYLALHEQDKPVNVRIWPEQLNPMDPSAIDLDYRLYSKSSLTLNKWRLILRKCNSAFHEHSFTLNEWEATLALGPFTNGTHSRNRGRV
jgi:hypothetical protein